MNTSIEVKHTEGQTPKSDDMSASDNEWVTNINDGTRTLTMNEQNISLSSTPGAVQGRLNLPHAFSDRILGTLVAYDYT